MERIYSKTNDIEIPAASSATGSSWDISWTHPGESQYVIEYIAVRFTMRSGNGYKVRATEVQGGNYTQRLPSKSGSAAVGDTITVPFTDSRAWENKTSGSFQITFYKVGGFYTRYNDIKLVIVYKDVATQSQVYVQPATAGEPQVVTLSNTDQGVYHTVRWQYAESSGTWAVDSGVITIPAANRSPSWAVPENLVAAVFRAEPNSAIHMGQVTVETFSAGGTSVGSQTVDAKLYLPENDTTRPSITAQSMSISHDTTAQAIRTEPRYADSTVQGHSTAAYSVSAQGYEGAGIAQIQILLPEGGTAAELSQSGSTYTGTRSSVIRTAGNIAIGIRVIDTRGFVREVAQQWTLQGVLAYQDPIITSLQAIRCNQQGNAAEDGTFVWVEAAAVVAEISSGMTLRAAVREKGSDTDIATGTIQNGSIVLGGGHLAETLSYVITVTVEDDFGLTGEASIEIGTGIMTISRMAGGKGVAFGKMAERYGVEISESWPFYCHGQEIVRLILDIAHPVGSSLESEDAGFNPNEKWPWTIWTENSGKWTRGV